MKAQDVMTPTVITVPPDMPVKEVAALMTDRHISGVPVVTPNGEMVGIVSQSDLLHRRELGTELKRKWWLKVFSDPDRMAREYTKSHGLKAQDIMSRHVTSVNEDADLSDVASILDRNKLKRVPVLRDGRIVGIVARSDLVKALSRTPAETGAKALGDGELHKHLSDKIREQPWLETSYFNVVVTDGAVALWGYVGSQDQRRALRVLVEETAGVKSLEDRLVVGFPTMGAI